MTKEKASSKIVILIIILSLLASVGLLYLVYKTWVIFGFWRIAITGLINTLASVIFIQFMGSGKSEKDGVIIYNPKEWPKFLGILVFLGVAYYLYDFISKKEGLLNLEYYYGVGYLSLLSFLPTLYNLFKLIRDRNDYVKINNGILSYKDNRTQEEFKMSDIQSFSKSTKNGIMLTFKDEKTHLIPIKNMNFNIRDSINLNNDLKALIPVKEKEASENKEEKNENNEESVES
tara:strand:+ start:291 stop:986 length:696 start_codon:yes stop_codon:yes gene_type:complete